MQQVFSISLILLLRLAEVELPHKDLSALWTCSGSYLDSLMCLALEALGCETAVNAAVATLDVVLMTDWWPYKLHCLMTHHALLKQRWIERRLARPLGEPVVAALHVMRRRLCPLVHEMQFPFWYDVVVKPYHWSEQDVNAALQEEEQMYLERLTTAAPISEPQRPCDVAVPKQTSTSRSAAFPTHTSETTTAAISEPFHRGPMPVQMTTAAPIAEPDTPCDVAVPQSSSKKYKWGECPLHKCARSPHVFGQHCRAERAGKAFLFFGYSSSTVFVFEPHRIMPFQKHSELCRAHLRICNKWWKEVDGQRQCWHMEEASRQDVRRFPKVQKEKFLDLANALARNAVH